MKCEKTVKIRNSQSYNELYIRLLWLFDEEGTLINKSGLLLHKKFTNYS